jgi:hypothetical protein
MPLPGEHGAYHVTQGVPGRLEPAFSPVAHQLCTASGKRRILSTYFLVQASQHLELVAINGVYQQFSSLTHTPTRSLPTA